jgi:L-asparagine transporter-like permease
VLASGSILAIYAGVCLSVLRLRQRDGLPKAGQFKVPGGPVVPLLGVLLIAWLLCQMTVEEAIGLGALVGVAILYYLVNRMLARRQTGSE